ncbi:MAG: LacI family DNA-binding transcriptional regulator [Prevotella sp.]|nr:LacI family DNA-binding transcriptional regulator [Prevotella sp.]
MKRTSLKDLAQKLGVSIATVSRALNGSHEISESLKTRVKQLATEMNYRPNPFAQRLRNDSSKVIGVILPNLVAHYFASVLDGIEEYALENGYIVICANSHEDYEMEKKAIDNLISIHVQGIIACLTQNTIDYQHFNDVEKMGIPLVFVNRSCLPEKYSSVHGNGDQAAYEATQHLIEQGCRRIAFVGGFNHLDIMRRRKHGYLEALRENRIPVERSLVATCNVEHEAAFNATTNLLRQQPRPDAILAFNDITLYGAFMAIKSMNLRIPEDVALIGFSESETTAFVTPPLSVIMDQSKLMGRKACEHLIKHINGHQTIQHEIVPMVIKLRESSEKRKNNQADQNG